MALSALVSRKPKPLKCKWLGGVLSKATTDDSPVRELKREELRGYRPAP
jgi:hypothetical protein